MARRATAITLLLFFAHVALSQKGDTIHFRSAVSITNNGFSFVPSFTLGKPAAIINLSVGGKRFTFEPELRFALEGKPWAFIFIWRYKVINTSTFQLTAGTHLPSIAFKTVTVQNNGVAADEIVAQRFLPFELSPMFVLSRHTTLGIYYLYGYGMEDKDQPKHGHFLSLRSNFTNIRLSNRFHFRFHPQVYYLKQDSRDGFFLASSIVLAKTGFPFSIGTMMNKVIETDIVVKDFDWNVTLIYSFNALYARSH